MDYAKESLRLHGEWKGKIEVKATVPVATKQDLSLAYTPGVAYPCLEIQKDPRLAYTYTAKGNTVAVVTDGSAVLGLGNIGPLAGLPVMEGKSLLMKELAGIDSFPICLNTQNVEEIISICKAIAPSFGAINLEDISAPRCVEIERRLIEELEIPVFHDDQHGTAIIVGAALINVERLTGRKLSDMTAVISGTGAAGSSIARHIKRLGIGQIFAYDINGVVCREKYDQYSFLIRELLDDGVYSSPVVHDDTLASLLRGADIFIGVSAPGLVTRDMIASMAKQPIVFAMANPTPEIMPEEAIAGGAYIVGTGRSDYPNQINNCLVFPGLFKGALSVRAHKINNEMKLAASYSLANVIPDSKLSVSRIVPAFTDPAVVPAVAEAVADAARKTGVA